MNKKIALIAFVLTASLALSGCGQKLAENKLERDLEKNLGGDYNVDLDKNNVEVVGEDGSKVTAGENVKLPSNFPKDVYLIDGDIASVVENLGMVGFQVTISTDKTLDEVSSVYQEKIPQDGWTINSSMNMGGMLMINAGKDNRVLTITTAPDEDSTDKTLISVTVVEN